MRAENVSPAVRCLDIALVPQQIQPVPFQVEAAGNCWVQRTPCRPQLRFRNVLKLVCIYHMVAVQVLGNLQGGGQGGAALMLQGPEVGLEEIFLPLVLFLENEPQVLAVVDQILQPAGIGVLQPGDARQAAPGFQQGAPRMVCTPRASRASRISPASRP